MDFRHIQFQGVRANRTVMCVDFYNTQTRYFQIASSTRNWISQNSVIIKHK